jgi:hypothetical protein
MEYNPFLSVTVPIFVFSQYTFAPTIGLNFSEEICSRTFPFMFCDSACIPIQIVIISMIYFFHDFLT